MAKRGKSKRGKAKKTTKSKALNDHHEIAYDFASKAYKKFSHIIKSIILFGSQSNLKKKAMPKSDIDIIIIVDDCTIQWDNELVAWYREELGKLVAKQTYAKALHLNTVRLSTWWEELLRGEPVVLNIIRYGESLIDFGGFFTPLKLLLQKGKIRPTAESIYVALRRSPAHLARTKSNLLSSIEGLYWACVDSAHAALMAAEQTPPSPEHIPAKLYETFVKKKKLNIKQINLFRELYILMHKVLHGELKDIKGADIDKYTDKVDLFVREMAKLVKEYEK